MDLIVEVAAVKGAWRSVISGLLWALRSDVACDGSLDPLPIVLIVDGSYRRDGIQVGILPRP